MVALATYGCSASGQTRIPPELPVTTATSTGLPVQIATEPAAPIETPSVTPTETAAPTATAFVPFTVSVWADNVNVRTNPGYLFPAIRLLAKGSNLTILGKAPGGEWLSARMPDGKQGWVFAQLIQSDADLQAVPVIEPKDVQLIKGRVLDSAGTPIQGVGFTVVQGSADHPATNTVLTDASGEFYSFIPPSARGQWTVTYNAIACKSNVWADNSCSTYKNPYRGTVEPQSVSVSLPATDALEFIWK